MEFTKNEVFIQVMEKLKEELQVHVESQAMPQWQFIIVGNLKCVEWCELNNMPYC